MTRLPTPLLHQPHPADRHCAVDRLAHVVDREQGDAAGGQGFHLHTRLTGALGGRAAQHAAGRFVHLELDRHPRERDRVAQRDQVAGLLGALDAGNAGNAQHVALLGRSALDQRQCRRQHLNPAFGDRDPVGAGLGRNIDHVGLALGVEMGQGTGGRGLGCVGHGDATLRGLYGNHWGLAASYGDAFEYFFPSPAAHPG